MHRAKLFLSCGQNRNYHELDCGNDVKDELSALGFNVFYAVDRQDGRSLTENIFQELREADYYVFVDFKKEELTPPSQKKPPKHLSKKVFRGSLFTHQEFGIACYLGLEIAAFREDGIEPLTGVVGAVMGNPIVFYDRTDLPNLVSEFVAHKIAQHEWSIHSRNRLKLCPTNHDGRIDQWTTGQYVSHYHINVTNLHHRKAATNCYAYIDEIIDVNTGQRVGSPYTCELKWEGTPLQGVRIGPKMRRGVDAFVVLHNGESQTLLFRPNTDANNHMSRFEDKANLLITYVVCSDEFPEARQQFKLSFNGRDNVSIIET